MGEREYRIGDMARIVGMSADGLRFYEKKGVIHAKKKENGYRYYSEKDLYRLMNIAYHRRMNASLDDIEEMMSEQGGEVGELRARIRQRMEQETRALQRHQMALRRLRLVEHDLDTLEMRMEQGCSVQTFPSGYLMGESPSLADGLSAWFAMANQENGLDMTYFYNELFFDEESQMLLPGKTKLIFYERLESCLMRPIDRNTAPPIACPTCVYQLVELSEPIPGVGCYLAMAEWAKSHGLVPGKKLYANNMITFFRGNVEKYYVELYLPLNGEDVIASRNFPPAERKVSG